MTVAKLLRDAQFETLQIDVSDAILTVTISRPEVLNALSISVLDDLQAVVERLTEHVGADDTAASPDWSVRGIIITGAGERAFVAGGDIQEMASMSRADAYAYAHRAQQLTQLFEALPVPVVAAVNGYALGGGCELALACDIIYASERAVFGQPEVLLGLIPGFGGTVRLQRLIGPQHARELILGGGRIDASAAQRLGLVSKIFDDRDALLAGAREYLHTVASRSPVAVAAAKRTLYAVSTIDVTDGLALELDAFAALFDTNDMREGTAAFLGKRAPEFPGS